MASPEKGAEPLDMLRQLRQQAVVMRETLWPQITRSAAAAEIYVDVGKAITKIDATLRDWG